MTTMRDRQDTDRLRQATDTTPDRRGVDVATAAAHLGITPDAVRGRLRRKSLAGELGANGQWTVYLDPAPGDRPPTGERQDTTGYRQAAESHETALVEALQAQVSDLQRRLDRYEVNMQMLIAKLPNPAATLPAMIEAAGVHQDTPHASPAATSDTGGDLSTPTTARRSWRFWRDR